MSAALDAPGGRTAEFGQIRVLIGEDQDIVREGIIRVLENGGFEVVGAASDARDLVGKARAYHPDVVVTDIQMPPDHTDDGLRAALEIRAAEPGTGVLVLSQFLEDRYAFDLLAGGAQGVGYLLKEKVAVRMFTESVRQVAEGGAALDPDVIARMMGHRSKSCPLDSLSKRESEVLALIAEGRSNSGIAQELVITISAVEHHVNSIFDKLGLHQSPEQHRRVLAVLTYLRSSQPSVAGQAQSTNNGTAGALPTPRRAE